MFQTVYCEPCIQGYVSQKRQAVKLVVFVCCFCCVFCLLLFYTNFWVDFILVGTETEGPRPGLPDSVRHSDYSKSSRLASDWSDMTEESN